MYVAYVTGMVIGMGASILIAEGGNASAPFIFIDKSCYQPANLCVTPCIPLFLQVNKWTGLPVNNAQ